MKAKSLNLPITEQNFKKQGKRFIPGEGWRLYLIRHSTHAILRTPIGICSKCTKVLRTRIRPMNFQKALLLHQKGDLENARKYYILDLESGSNRYEAIFNLGMIDLQKNNFSSAALFFNKAISLKSNDIASYANAGLCYQQIGDWKRAENFFTNAYNLDPVNIKIINHLAAILSKQGKANNAIALLDKALLVDPFNFEVLINAGMALTDVGQHIQALTYFEKAAQAFPKHEVALAHLASALLEVGRYEDSLIQCNLAIKIDPKCSLGYLTKALTQHKLQNFDQALENYQYALQLDPGSQVAQLNIATITISKVKDENDFVNALKEADKSHKMTSFEKSKSISRKVAEVPFFRLKHDVQQAYFLESQGSSSTPLLQFLDVIPSILEGNKSEQGQKLINLTGDALKVFRDYQNDSFIYQMPILNTMLNSELDWRNIEEKYLFSEPELIFIDNFLNNEALKAFQNFSLYSKVWNKEYKGCYLGAFANQGFISPLHLKLALELKSAMPMVFKDYPIGQLWGFKYDAQLGSGINVHADFAKINLNFWITPSESNLDANSGGLRIYTVPAPITWKFHDYNRDSELIYEFLTQKKSSSVTIPYKGNRAVLFNSALFHETDVIKFKEGYENRRVNMTYLFGNQLA